MAKKQRICNWEKVGSSINDVGKAGQLYAKRMILAHYFITYTKINPKLIKTGIQDLI